MLHHRKYYKVPKGMQKILDTINSAHNGKITWDKAVEKVKSITVQSIKRGESLFRQQKETTTLFYKEALKAIENIKNCEKDENIISSGISVDG